MAVGGGGRRGVWVALVVAVGLVAGVAVWRVTGPRVDLVGADTITPVHAGEPLNMGFTVHVKHATALRVSGVSLGALGPAARVTFLVHPGRSPYAGGGGSQGALPPDISAISRPAVGALVRDGDTLIATIVFDRPGTYRLGRLRLEHGAGLRRRADGLRVHSCVVATERTVQHIQADLSPCGGRGPLLLR
ncbi:MAG TPA: hypothetical protein VFJ85_06620 [Acidimicrobiales bacterium]|nr:hypothetical protein [Acidimicrobiales bacterium]